MAEAQFKCPETQPTPARAEGGRGNGAAALPRGPARARTHAAGLGCHTRRLGAEGKTRGAAGAGGRGTQGGCAHARRPAGPRAPAQRAGSRARMRRRRRGAPCCGRATELGGESRHLGRETRGERPTQSPWASQAGELAERTGHSCTRMGPIWGASHACAPSPFHIPLSGPHKASALRPQPLFSPAATPGPSSHSLLPSLPSRPLPTSPRLITLPVL